MSPNTNTNTATHLDNPNALSTTLPAEDGFWGQEQRTFGDAFLPLPLEPITKNVDEEYSKIKVDLEFLSELSRLRKTFIGRPPSAIYHCQYLLTSLEELISREKILITRARTKSIIILEKPCLPRKWARLNQLPKRGRTAWCRPCYHGGKHPCSWNVRFIWERLILKKNGPMPVVCTFWVLQGPRF